MAEKSATYETTIRDLYAQLMGPGCMEDRATAEVAAHFFAEDVELVQMRSILGTGGRFIGLRGIVESNREVVRDFAEAMFMPEQVHALGDRVGTVVVFSGKGRRSGAPVEIRVGHLFTLRDGLIVRWEVLEDPREALKAVGLEE